ncbi:MAG: hypothetical protein K6F32_03860 [Bacilli bacterium]|nr:hypothetical protein [Bacilli bacterium]
MTSSEEDPTPVSSEEPPVTSSEEDPMPAEYDIRKMWAGNPGEECYSVVDRDDKTIITYEDVTGEGSGGWEYVSRSFAYDAAYRARFDVYKKISFTGKLDVESGSDIVMVKVQGAGGTFEKRFNFTSKTKTYEFGLSFVTDWSQVDSILFFANRSVKESGNGTITIDKFVLSQEEVNSAYDIAPGMPSIPQDYTYYNGETDKLDVMYRWGYNSDGEIETTEVDGGFKFTWGGKKANPWSYVSALVKNSDDHALQDSGFKRIAFTVTGTANKEVLFKFQDKSNATSVEKRAVLTGEEQAIELDITKVIANQDYNEFLVAIFPDPGATGEDIANGELTLKGCAFDTTAVVVPDVLNDAYYPAYFLDAHNRADSCYTVYHDKHVTTVNYEKNATGWESIEYKLNSKVDDWWDKNFNRVVGRVEANVDVKVLLKAYDNGAGEHWLDLKAGVAQDVDYTVSKDIVDLTKGFYVFICAGDEGGTLKGTVTFTDLRLTREFANVGYTGNVPLNKVTSAGAYTISNNEDGDLVADYSFEASGYQGLEMLVTADDIASYNKIVGTITSTVDVHVIIKPMDNGANETNIALTANTAYELDYSFTAVPFNPMWAKVIIMICVDASDTLAGSVTFGGLHLEAFDPYAVGTGLNTATWSGVYLDQYSFASDCYNLRKDDNGDIVVNYKKTASGWENIQAGIELPEDWWDVHTYNRAVGTLTATVDVTVLLKPFDNGAAEKWFNLKANEPTLIDYTFDSTICDLSKKFIVFIAAGDNPGALEGKVVLHDLMLCRPDAAIENNDRLTFEKIGVAASCYTVSYDDDGMKVAYDKTAEQQWEIVQLFSKARDYSKYNKLHVKLVCTADCEVLLKVADNNANEHRVSLKAGVEQVIDVEQSVAIDAKWEKSVIFIGQQEVAQTGTLTISDFYLYHA